MASANQPFVRPYSPGTDDQVIEHIFRVTADPLLSAEPTQTIAYQLWARSYTQLSPRSCFVLDPNDGTAPVGYIIGTPSTSAFAHSWATQFLPSIPPDTFPAPIPNSPLPEFADDPNAALLWMLYHPEILLNPKHPHLVEEFPGHLHVDILPAYQGKGHGKALMERFTNGLREERCEGVHLAMNALNKGAERFYSKLGFERWREVMDAGDSGETGRQGGSPGTLWLVKELKA